MIVCTVLIEREHPYAYHKCSLDLTLSPEIERAFTLDSQCLGTVFAVVDDFGDLVYVDPWRSLEHYRQRTE